MRWIVEPFNGLGLMCEGQLTCGEQHVGCPPNYVCTCPGVSHSCGGGPLTYTCASQVCYAYCPTWCSVVGHPVCGLDNNSCGNEGYNCSVGLANFTCAIGTYVCWIDEYSCGVFACDTLCTALYS